MINVVYLVLVLTGLGDRPSTSVLIPQANMNQCLINRAEYSKERKVYEAYCIVGVK